MLHARTSRPSATASSSATTTARLTRVWRCFFRLALALRPRLLRLLPCFAVLRLLFRLPPLRLRL